MKGFQSKEERHFPFWNIYFRFRAVNSSGKYFYESRCTCLVAQWIWQEFITNLQYLITSGQWNKTCMFAFLSASWITRLLKQGHLVYFLATHELAQFFFGKTQQETLRPLVIMERLKIFLRNLSWQTSYFWWNIPYLPVYKSTFQDLKISPKIRPWLIHGSKLEIQAPVK